MSREFEGRWSLVTGAGQGIGRATALRLGESGSKLVLTDVNTSHLAETVSLLPSGTTSESFVADLRNEVDCLDVAGKALQASGGITHLASLAGAAARANIFQTDSDTWDEMIGLNLRSHFILIREISKKLVDERRDGSIVCAGSLNSYGGQPDLCAYSVAKGGLSTLVRHSAHALLPHRVRVNIVNFGWMKTAGELDVQMSAHGRDEEWLDHEASQLPFGRLITPEEAADLLVYMLSDRSSVMTGASVDFDQSVPGSGPTTAIRTDFLKTPPS